MRTRQMSAEEFAPIQRLFSSAEFDAEAERPQISISSEEFLKLISYLKDGELRMIRLENLTAVDYKDFFEMVYHLFSPEKLCWAMVKVKIPRETAEVPSVTGIFPGANFEEREVYDLMGIRFAGHPDLRRVFLPEDFAGHPLRKDFKNPPPPDVPRIRRER